jgi:glucose/mannose-6-phosphate isomerase
MEKLIAAFPAQLEEALNIGSGAQVTPGKGIHEVLVCGMGGSGVGAHFLQSIAAEDARVPIIANKNYTLPGYVDEQTLVIVSSYSGNTEETLSAYQHARERNCPLIAITSGGTLLEKAKSSGLDFIQLPAGYPAPRACLGFSLVAQLFALQKAGYVDNFFEGQIVDAIERLRLEQNNLREKAEQIARLLADRIPVLYGANRTGATLLRWRQQLNENAKHLCWHQVFPEMNHNEIVGWKGDYSKLMVVALRHRDDLHRNQLRMDLTREVFQHWAGGYMEVYSRGASFLEKSLYLVHLGDWVSYYLAEIKGENPDEVKVIDHLKKQLKKYD